MAVGVCLAGCPDDQDTRGDWYCGATCPAKNPATCESAIGTASDSRKSEARRQAVAHAHDRFVSGCDYAACGVDCRAVGQ